MPAPRTGDDTELSAAERDTALARRAAGTSPQRRAEDAVTGIRRVKRAQSSSRKSVTKRRGGILRRIVRAVRRVTRKAVRKTVRRGLRDTVREPTRIIRRGIRKA